MKKPETRIGIAQPKVSGRAPTAPKVRMLLSHAMPPYSTAATPKATCLRRREFSAQANSRVNTGASSAQSQKMDAKVNSTMQNTRKKPL